MITYAIRHALEVLGDSGFDEDIRRAALAELDDLEDAVTGIRQAIGAALLISTDGETKMPREDWLRIESAMLAAGVQTPVVAVVAPEEDE